MAPIAAGTWLCSQRPRVIKYVAFIKPPLVPSPSILNPQNRPPSIISPHKPPPLTPQPPPTRLWPQPPGGAEGWAPGAQGAKHTDMKAEKGVFSWNLPRLGIDLLLRPPHPAGRFLPPGSRVWGRFGAFPRRRFHLCFGRFSTRFELESNRDRKAGIAGRIRPRRARPRRGPQPTITGNR